MNALLQAAPIASSPVPIRPVPSGRLPLLRGEDGSRDGSRTFVKRLGPQRLENGAQSTRKIRCVKEVVQYRRVVLIQHWIG